MSVCARVLAFSPRLFLASGKPVHPSPVFLFSGRLVAPLFQRWTRFPRFLSVGGGFGYWFISALSRPAARKPSFPQARGGQQASKCPYVQRL